MGWVAGYPLGCWLCGVGSPSQPVNLLADELFKLCAVCDLDLVFGDFERNDMCHKYFLTLISGVFDL